MRPASVFHGIGCCVALLYFPFTAQQNFDASVSQWQNSVVSQFEKK